MSTGPSYAARIVSKIAATVALTPASWTQWAADLAADTDTARALWSAVAEAAGVELRSDVKRDALHAIAHRAGREFNATVVAVHAADARLAAEAAR